MKAFNPNTGQWEDLYVKALDSFPVGVIVEYPTTDSAKLPTGYMFCDGSAISRTEYSELFSLIGTSFGAGNGSTTFNIPSKEGVVTAGIKSSDTDFDTIGETLGSKTVTLTTQQIPSHNHAMETYRQYGTGSQGDNSTKIGRTQSNADGGTANITTLNQGGGQPHNNIQPTQISNFIIKVKPTRVLASTVVNAYNKSTENAYSCDYLNDCNTYSTSETFTGKYWIDNKPIYRKCFNITDAISANTEKTFGSDANIDVVINIYGVMTRSNGNDFQINSYSDASAYCFARIDRATSHSFVLKSSLAGTGAFVVTEYTKTN